MDEWGRKVRERMAGSIVAILGRFRALREGCDEEMTLGRQ